MACILKEVSGDDRNDDSSFASWCILAFETGDGQAHLARSQDTIDLPHDGLITAQIRRRIENEANIETKVVPLILPHEFDWKA